jgi:hypothetical protein
MYEIGARLTSLSAEKVRHEEENQIFLYAKRDATGIQLNRFYIRLLYLIP